MKPLEYKVTLYGCPFKCGQRHTKNKNLITAHIARCWSNPENRTCKTCRYEEYYSDTSGASFSGGWQTEPKWYVRTCERGDGEPAIEAIYDELREKHPDNENLYSVQIPPVVHCEFWEKSK